MIHPYLLRLHEEVFLSNPPILENGQPYFISFEKGLGVSVVQTSRFFVLQAILGPAPEINAEEHLIDYMHANLFGQGTAGGVIGMDEAGKNLSFSLALPVHIPYKQFKESMEDFVNYLELWQKKVISTARELS